MLQTSRGSQAMLLKLENVIFIFEEFSPIMLMLWYK